ncbi:MAG TPA: hypothetical protein DD001_19530 [Microcoleaceae bacterium UBA10368]|jgi:hypothetical protein|nr:hypothetical protein [Microcoleaceae cyanobacterium UBA10368]
MSGGPFGWIGGGFAEIASQVNKVFSSDDASGSNSGQTQARTNSVSESSNSGEAQVRNIGGYQRAGEACNGQSAWSQAFEFDPSTNDVNTKLRESGCKGKAGIYLIRDEHDERTLYVGKAEGTSRDILSRLKAHLTGEGNSGISERIERGETVTIRWVECDDQKKYESVVMAYLLPSDNERAEYLGAERTRIEEEIAIGILLDLPSFWHENYEKMLEEAHEQGWYVAGYGSNRVEVAEAIFWRCNEETKENYDDDRGSGGSSSSNDSEDKSDSWFGGLFGDSSDSEPSDNSDSSNSDSGDSDNSWFGGFFGGSSDSESSDSSDSSNSDSDSSNSSDSGSSYSSDYGSENYGNSGDSDYGSSDYGSGDYGDSSDSDSGSSSSDSYDSDSGSSDDGSGNYGDSGGSDSSSSSSDSWW